MDLKDGEIYEMKGSASKPYVLRNVGGVYSCSCPAWRNQSFAIEQRTCKHLRKLRGDEAERERIGNPLPINKTEAKEGPPLLLAQSWDQSRSLEGWWLSEKLDGVRAYWDGENFLSRQGNLYHAPDWFVESLPSEPLDGELWIDRKAFQRTVSVVRRQDKSKHWEAVRFLVFDAPEHGGTFEERMSYLSEVFAQEHPHAEQLGHTQCESDEALKEELARIESLGGEGLMAREPGSHYAVGRSETLLKIKSFLDDEAIVLEHLPGKGRHKGRLGALFVQLSNGTKFSVGTGFTDAEREEPPEIGSVITFRYQELSDGGVPRFPTYLRLRPDAQLDEETIQAALHTHQTQQEQAPESSDAQGDLRRFEFSDDKSHKFWEVEVAELEVTVRYGRVGTKGQTKVKAFKDEDAAHAFVQKSIDKKTSKGYEEC